MPVDPVIIKLKLDDSEIKSGVDRLAATGQIDEQNAIQFKKTNDALSDRTTILKQNNAEFDKLTASVTPQQVAFNKLTVSLKDLFGTSKQTAEQLLKLGAGTLFDGLKAQNLSIDEFILKLKALQVGTKDLPVNFQAATDTVNQFIAAAKGLQDIKTPEIVPTSGTALPTTATTPVGNLATFSTAQVELAKQNNALVKEAIADNQQLTATITPQQAVYNKLAASVKTLSGNAKEAATQLLNFTPEQITQGFKDAGISIDDYVKILETASSGQDTFNESAVQTTTRLNEIKNELAALGPITDENKAQFAALAAEGGKLQEGLTQARGVIRTLGSESPVLTATTNVVRGLTGAFQAAAGAATLFGEKNKDLQEVMVRVFQITSITQGISEVLNTVNQKGTITTLQAALATKAAAVNTALLNAQESENIIISGLAAAAQRVLNAVMAANPIGLFVTALVLVTGALAAFVVGSAHAQQQVEEFNSALDDSKVRLTNQVEELKRNGQHREDALKENNAKESEIALNQAKTLVQIQAQTQKELAIIDAEIKKSQLEGVDSDEALEAAFKLGDRQLELQRQVFQQQVALDKKSSEVRKVLTEEYLQNIKDNATAELNLKIQGSKAFFAAERVETNAALQLDLKLAGDNEGKKALVKSNAQKKFQEIDAAEQTQIAATQLAKDEINLIHIQTVKRRLNSQISDEESQAEDKILEDQTAAKIRALQKQADIDKSFRKDANVQIALLQEQLEQQLEESERQRQIRRITLARQDAIAINNIQLAGVKATNAQRLELETQNELDTRDIALTNTSLTEAQKLAIIAQSEEKIRQLRNAAVEKQAQDSIEIAQSLAAGRNAELQRELDAQDQIRAAGTRGKTVAAQLGVPILNVDQQKQAIDDLTQFQLDQNFKLIKANLDVSQSDEDRTKKGVALQAEADRILKAGQLQKLDLDKKTDDARRQRQQENIQAVAQSAQQVLGFLDEVFAAQDKADQDRLDRQRKQVQDELDAGEITAKAAAVRNKELDAQQRKLQQEQAKRQKEMALFTAIINTASAVAVALTGGPIAGVIAAVAAAAIGAAEIALIAATPIPQFYQGKNMDKLQRDNYEGWGKIGEKGSELWKSGSEMRLAEKETIVWLKRDDVVYTPAQTAAIISNPQINGRIPVEFRKASAGKIEIDYKKLADAISKRPYNLNIDGYKDFLQTEKDFTVILNNRRKWQ